MLMRQGFEVRRFKLAGFGGRWADGGRLVCWKKTLALDLLQAEF